MSGNARGIRRPNDQFTLISNDLIRNGEIRPAAFRVAVYVLSHDTKWQVSQASIGRALKLSTETVAKAFRELADLGYARRVAQHSHLGRQADEVIISHEKLTEAEWAEELGSAGQSPTPETPNGETPNRETGVRKKTNSKKTKDQEDQEEILSSELDGSDALFDVDPPQSAGTTKAHLDVEFATWYVDYPRKEGKGQALTAFRKARHAGATLEALTRGLSIYVSRLKRDGVSKQYTKLPATWLNGQCWDDEDVVRGNGGGASGVTYRGEGWAADAAEDRDENGLTAEDRYLQEHYGATVSYG